MGSSTDIMISGHLMVFCADAMNGAAGIFPRKYQTPLIITVFSSLRGRGTGTQISIRKKG